MFEERNDVVSFGVQSSVRPRQQAELHDPTAVCTSYGQKGHQADHYFRKIGYPIWWGDQSCSKLPSSQTGISSTSSQPSLLHCVEPEPSS